MSVSQRFTGRYCKRDKPIYERIDPFYVLQQSDPYDTQIDYLCCPECEAEDG